MRNTKVFVAILGVIVSLTLSGVADAADQIQIIKAKGRKAVVKFPEGWNPQKGESYAIAAAGEESVTSDSGSAPAGSREYSLGVSAGYSSSTVKTDTGSSSSTQSEMSLSGSVGFNFGAFELGPKLSYTSRSTGDSSGSVTLSSTLIGGFGEFNFTPNTAPNKFVPGARLEFLLVSGASGYPATSTTAAYSISDSGNQYSLGVFGKFFVLGTSSTALRADLGYNSQTIKRTVSTSSSSTTTSGIALSGGIVAYF